MFGRRILILIPHPDDETVGAAAAIARARARGAAVAGIYLTTGVPDVDVAWIRDSKAHAARVARRRAEGRAAAEQLGLEPLMFLDHPTRTLRLHLGEARTTVEAALTDWNADTLWVPAFEGGHQDHDSANALASLFRNRLPVWEFAEYGKAGLQTFPAANGTEHPLPLTPEEMAEKCRLLALYVSERKNLRGMGVERECFRPLPVHDYTRAPHAGTPHYARFRWVPFRHPRVDFTDPAEVARAAAAFLAATAEHP
jgi:LmbE family N-acetylglucosaminyl deacetylase